jgi:phosphatidate cytidylyltransferase
VTTSAKPPSNLLLRIVSAVIALPLIMLLLFRGPSWAFFLLTFPAALLGAFELFAMTHQGDPVSQLFGVLLSAAASLAVFLFTGDSRVVLTVLIAIPLCGPLLTLVRLGDIKTAALRAFSLSIGPLFVGVPLTLLAVMRRDAGPEGPALVVLALGFSWGADTGGYFGGRFFGRRKLYEAVSPKKTMEGAVGGLLGALSIALALNFTLLRSIPLVHMIALSLVAGVLGQAGDLGESLIKRSVGVKDSGAIVPGHGGILDRVDALIFTSAVLYLYTIWR